MNEKLLTQEELAERWQVSKRAIENWRKQGVITPAKGVPVIRFTEKHILELEGVRLEKVSPLIMKRLEKENEVLLEENKQLKSILANIAAESSKLYLMEVAK